MDILFSLLYVENYRSIDRRGISFDHRYECRFDSDNGCISISRREGEAFGRYFYGKNIYSVTCLVGKNGEGKTTLVNFLRDSFALLKDDIDNGYSSDGLALHKDWKGVIELSGERARYYHLDPNTRFLVIFQEGGRDYYLTNIKEQRILWADNSRCLAYVPPKRKEVESYAPERVTDTKVTVDFQVAYFSMMRFLDGIEEEERAYGREKDEKVMLGSEETLRFNKILDRHNIDFSEEEMNRKRKKKGDVGINEDLIMQIAFLRSRDDKELQEILGNDYKCRLEVITSFGSRWQYSELLEESKWDDKLIREFLESPRSHLRPFSSGQYSRFAFLARLHWYLGGSEDFWETPFMKRLIGTFLRRYWADDTASIEWLKESKINSKSVILLIDESELYYHPEWQRCFVKDVFDIISRYKNRVDVQVVFTTSSTFMLSDILREDVVILSTPKKEQMSYLDGDIQTFGQNIHMLLANRFFMDSTIGKRSEELITDLFEILKVHKVKTEDGKEDDEKLEAMRERIKCNLNKRFQPYIDENKQNFITDAGYDVFLQKLIGSIGEDFYRRQLLGMFEEYRSRLLDVSSLKKEIQELLMKNGIEGPDAEKVQALLQQF